MSEKHARVSRPVWGVLVVLGLLPASAFPVHELAPVVAPHPVEPAKALAPAADWDSGDRKGAWATRQVVRQVARARFAGLHSSLPP